MNQFFRILRNTILFTNLHMHLLIRYSLNHLDPLNLLRNHRLCLLHYVLNLTLLPILLLIFFNQYSLTFLFLLLLIDLFS